MFVRLGAEVVDADRAAHEALGAPGVRRALVRAFGSDILGHDGSVDRAALARKAFAGAREVRALNAAVHPAVRREIRRRIAASRAPVVVVDAALLQETGGDRDYCTAVAYVHAPRRVRLKRLRDRGWSPAEVRRRERWQWRVERKRARAGRVIDNGGPAARTFQHVKALWSILWE